MQKIKIFTLFTTIILLFSVFGASVSGFAAFTPDFDVHSEGVYMVNTDTDIVVMSKNADKKMYPASTTKIMTALVTLANVSNFNAIVDVPYDCFNEFNEDNPNFIGPSGGGIDPRQDNLTYNDALYSMMIASACESANILAYNVGGGSIANFVQMMNDTAAQIGCKNTHFSNPHGLFAEDNYSTPYDMYLITKYAIDHYPAFMKICSTYSYDMPANKSNPGGYTLTHTNKMMQSSSDYYYEGVSGIKTGSIDKYYYKTEDGQWSWNNFEYGSRALVTTAQRNGYTYLLVTMGAPYCNEDGTATDTLYNFTDHINLYNWAFNEFEYTLVIGKNQQIMQASVDKGLESDKVGIVATQDYYTLLPKTLDVSTIQQIKPTLKPIEAPVEKGMLVGKLELKLNGETLTKLKLVTERAVSLDMTEYYKEKLGDVLKMPQCTAIGVLLGALVVVIIANKIARTQFNRAQAERNRRRKAMQMAPRTGANRSNVNRNNINRRR